MHCKDLLRINDVINDLDRMRCTAIEYKVKYENGILFTFNNKIDLIEKPQIYEK